MDTDKTIDESRSLVISDFRNLGVSALRKSKDEKTYLKINRSLKKDELGGLVIILGSNNSGKTNVLDAVEKFTKGEYDDDDLTDFITAPKAPYLTLDVAGGKYGEIVAPKIMTGTANCKISGPAVDVLLYILRQRESFDLFNDWMKDTEHCDDIVYYMSGIEEQIRYSYADIEEELGKAYAHILRNREGILGESLKEIANEFEKGDITRYIIDRCPFHRQL